MSWWHQCRKCANWWPAINEPTPCPECKCEHSTVMWLNPSDLRRKQEEQKCKE